MNDTKAESRTPTAPAAQRRRAPATHSVTMCAIDRDQTVEAGHCLLVWFRSRDVVGSFSGGQEGEGKNVKIALLRIENFRGIKSGTIHFRDHTVLIGPNNSGKTTIIEALALILGRDRLVRSLTEHDFFGSNPQPADRIRIVATITGFEPEDFAEHPDWFLDGRGVPTWFARHCSAVAHWP